MQIKKLTTVFFSPTDSTANLLVKMAQQLPLPLTELNLTDYTTREQTADFNAEDLVIFGVPVYGGRVPATAVERFKNMHGNQTPAVLIASYGNRDYDDALLELHDVVKQNGFIPCAAAAFITEHSIMHSIAQGRPDAADEQKIQAFTEQVWTKIQHTAQATDFAPLTIKGNQPYKEYNGVPFKPEAGKGCQNCGLCVKNCPVGAISLDAQSETDKDLCISCMRCLKKCPTQVRHLNKLMLGMAEKGFAKKCAARREPEIFI